MRRNQGVRCNACIISLCYAQNAGEVPRRNAPRLPPPIHGNGINAALSSYLIPLPDPRQYLFDWCIHAPIMTILVITSRG